MLYFIVNPKACSGKGMRLWEHVARELHQSDTEYKVFFTRHRHHATQLAQSLSTSCENCTVVAVGGDGTANEVIDGLQSFKGVRFAYIPTGSGNDLARGLSLSANPSHVLAAILNPKTVQDVNVGVIRVGEESHRFVVSSGIGFDAAVCHEALDSSIKNTLNRLRIGKMTYMWIALKQLFMTHPCAYTLTLDDGEPLSYKKAYFCAFMNTKYEGGGFMFCPKADAQDDYLDICLLEKMPRLKILFLLPTAFGGKHTGLKKIHIMRCKQALIQAENALPIHTDGESQGIHNTMAVSLEPEKLSFIIN